MNNRPFGKVRYDVNDVAYRHVKKVFNTEILIEVPKKAHKMSNFVGAQNP